MPLPSPTHEHNLISRSGSKNRFHTYTIQRERVREKGSENSHLCHLGTFAHLLMFLLFSCNSFFGISVVDFSRVPLIITWRTRTMRKSCAPAFLLLLLLILGHILIVYWYGVPPTFRNLFSLPTILKSASSGSVRLGSFCTSTRALEELYRLFL